MNIKLDFIIQWGSPEILHEYWWRVLQEPPHWFVALYSKLSPISLGYMNFAHSLHEDLKTLQIIFFEYSGQVFVWLCHLNCPNYSNAGPSLSTKGMVGISWWILQCSSQMWIPAYLVDINTDTSISLRTYSWCAPNTCQHGSFISRAACGDIRL